MVAKKKADDIYWVVMYRKFLTWKVHSLYSTERLADIAANDIEFNQGLTTKVERAKLEG